MNNKDFLKYSHKALQCLGECNQEEFFEAVGILEYLKYEEYTLLLKSMFYYQHEKYQKCIDLLDCINLSNINEAFQVFYWDYKVASMAQLHRFDEIRDLFLYNDYDDITMSYYSYALAKYISLREGYGNDPGIYRPDSLNIAPNIADDYFYTWFYQALYGDLVDIYYQNEELLLLKKARIDKSIKNDIKGTLIERLNAIELLLDDQYLHSAPEWEIEIDLKKIVKRCKNFITQDKSIDVASIKANMRDNFNRKHVSNSISNVYFEIETGIRLLEGEELFQYVDGYNAFFRDGLNKKNETVAGILLNLCYEEKLKQYQNKDGNSFAEYWEPQIESALPDFRKYNEVYFCRPDIYDGLSDGAKWVYKAAIWQYEQVMENGDELMDAGLLSLSFMRILEVELNERFIYPLKDRFKRDKKASEVISDKMYGFGKLINSEKHGLTLGEIRAIFEGARLQETAEGKLVYTAYKEMIMSDDGISALEHGRLEKMIREDIVESYRNPPAHARYLQKKTAVKAKDHVEDSLKEISKYYLANEK